MNSGLGYVKGVCWWLTCRVYMTVAWPLLCRLAIRCCCAICALWPFGWSAASRSRIIGDPLTIKSGGSWEVCGIRVIEWLIVVYVCWMLVCCVLVCRVATLTVSLYLCRELSWTTRWTKSQTMIRAWTTVWMDQVAPAECERCQFQAERESVNCPRTEKQGQVKSLNARATRTKVESVASRVNPIATILIN